MYERIKKILAAHGATFRHVVSETIYLTDWDRFGDGAAIRKKFFDDDGAAYPSAVGQQVAALAVPGLVLEVQIIAYMGEKKVVNK